jgi:class 3 adenylate cyclase/tetratricopeptide (TPR) repeat protein
VNCPRCAAANAPLARFCQACGLALARGCAACGSPLGEGARFCSSCGTPVAAPTGEPAAAAPAAETPKRAGERRQATVLFADIAGYTALCGRLDAEQVQALLNEFYAAMDGAVVAHGGTVIDHAGDGVLAAFGAPVAHGNDVERALRSALAMQTAAARMTDPSTGGALALHVGIASGEVVAATLEGGATPKYAVTGDTVNLAARIEALAGSGETLVSESVQRAVAALVETEDLGPKALKGYPAPVRVFRAHALRAGPGDRLPFVGRQAELRQLDGALDNLRGGSGATLLIRGDAGMGKSRLVEKLGRRAGSRGCAVHVARVLDFGVGAHDDALATVAASLLGLGEEAGAGERRTALDAAIVQGRLDERHEASLADLLGIAQRPEVRGLYDAIDHATRLGRAADALAALAATAAQAQPRLVAFEDIHWASPLLLGCLATLAMGTRQVPLLLAMTSRFEGDPIDRAWRAASHGAPLLTIDMGPLSTDEARTLAGGMLQASDRFAQQCIERAEGNPLFLEQLLRNALEAESAGVPPTIQSLVLARMDRLPARDKLALQAASVIGKRFPLDALRFLLDDAGYRCDTLLATDLVRPEAGDYLFAHALIQEGVYASLLHARRRELHARAASWYAGREPALMAEHFDRAQRPAEAADAYLQAARAQAERHRYDDALRLAQRGAALAPEGEVGSALVRLQGDVLRELGRTDESLRAFEQALERAVDDAGRARAWLGIAAALRITGDVARAFEVLDRAQPVAEALGDGALRSRIHSLRGNLSFAVGRIDDCGREHALALEHATAAADREAESLALSGLGDHAYAQGRMQSASRHFRRCVALSRELGLVRADIVNSCMVGHCLTWSGDGDAGLREVQAAVALAERLGVPQTRVMAMESLAMTLTLRGDVAAAEPVIDQAIDVARRASARRYLSIDLMMRANCRHLQGRTRDAREALDEAVELARQTGLAFIGAAIYASIALTCDDPAERRKWIEDGEVLANGALVHARLMFYRHAVDAALLDDRLDEALRFAAAAEACEHDEPLILAHLGAARARGLVRLRREGARPETVAELRALADESRRVGMGSLAYGIEAAIAAAGARGATGAETQPR